MDLVSQDQTTGWSLEPTRFHGPNVGICKVIIVTSRTLVIGEYLPLTMLDHLSDIEEALEGFRGQDLIFMGDLNVDLYEALNPHIQLVAYMLTYFGLTDPPPEDVDTGLAGNRAEEKLKLNPWYQLPPL